MKPKRDWWGIAWKGGALAILAVAGILIFVRAFWNLTSSFQDQLQSGGYPTATITVSTTVMDTMPTKTQPLYIAHVQVGSCRLRLDRAQWQNGFSLKEVNGRAVDDPENSPNKEQALVFLSSRGIHC